MDFAEYQEEALKSDKIPTNNDNDKIVPLLGLAGEAGQLLSEYKKYLRDGPAHIRADECIEEELGDLLWYISNVATKFGLSLNSIAKKNLHKCHERWIQQSKSIQSFDSGLPYEERFPRQFVVKIDQVCEGNLVKIKLSRLVDNKEVPIGDPLTDNSHSEDGYRFHDVFHFAYAAVLGWSPVTRKLIGCKREDKRIDEVEDGGRAKAIEEGISALVFSYAKDHNFFEGISTIDFKILKVIKSISYFLEVSNCSFNDWEKAILLGYDVWRQVDENKGGIVKIDLNLRDMKYEKIVRSACAIKVMEN